MNYDINDTTQLELGFIGYACPPARRREQTRIERANWWFARMRAAVDNAINWSPRPTPPPQQIWLAQ